MRRTISKRIKSTLLGKLCLRLLIFNVSFFVGLLLLAVFYNATDTIFWSLFGSAWDGWFNAIGVALVFGYIAGTLLCFYSVLATAAGYIETIANGVGMVTDSRQVLEFPDEIKAVEMSLRNLQYTIYRNEQMAKEAEQRKNDLVVYLAHDLKTPLTSVIGYLSLLEESPDLPVEQRAKYTSITLEKAYRLEQLINEFFDITRFNLQSITLENNRIDLGVMLRQLADEFYPVLAEKGLDVAVHVTDEITLIGDADKLARVLDNLLRNAVSYSYLNTTIDITCWRDGGWAAITVRNRGDEIPPAQLDRVFEKFFRLDSARQTRSGGAGLGLAIAKQIVELHGGRITVRSNAEYTEFMVALPIRM